MRTPFSSEAESLISSMRGLPEETTNVRDKGTKGFSSVLEACIKKFHIGQRTPEETIIANWATIVGKSFASRCRPERIDPSGTLLIQVSNPTLKRELIFMEDRILTALGSMEGCQHIRRIALKAGL